MEESKSYHLFIQGKMQSFYESTFPLLVVYARRILGNESRYLAEDIVQEAIIKTYENRHKLKDMVQLRSYVYITVRNYAISELRKLHHHNVYLQQLPSSKEEQDAEMVLQGALSHLYDAVRQMPDDMQELFKMNFEEGLKLKEIAVLLNSTEIAVRKKKSRMIHYLRKKMGLSDPP